MAKPKDLKKTRITIRLDADVVQYFQTLADEQDRPYQPLMNKVLRDYVNKKLEINSILDNATEIKAPIATGPRPTYPNIKEK